MTITLFVEAELKHKQNRFQILAVPFTFNTWFIMKSVNIQSISIREGVKVNAGSIKIVKVKGEFKKNPLPFANFVITTSLLGSIKTL